MEIQFTVLEIQFQPLNARLLIGYAKISSNFSFLSKRYKVITECRWEHPTSNSFQKCSYSVYLFKLHDSLIIILLTTDLTNICSKISKARLIWWMVYTYNVKATVKGLKEVKKLGRNECTLHRWPRSPEMSDCRRPYQ